MCLRAALEKAPERVTIRRIDEDHGNPLKLWEAMGSPQVPTPEQVRQIQAQSAVEPESLPFTYADGWLHLSVTLGDNDVFFIEIS